MLVQPSTFQVFQHAMSTQLSQQSSPLTDDFVVILQKATAREAGALAGLIDGNLVEQLNQALELSKEQAFAQQNIKSILRNITVAFD